MKRLAAFAIAVVGLAACGDNVTSPDSTTPSLDLAPAGPGTVLVTSSADAGPGSFRAALAAAEVDGTIAEIRFLPQVRSIALQSSLVFSGGQALRIHGNNAELVGSGIGSGSALLIDGGGDLEIHNLRASGAPGTGITVAIPAGRTGTVTILLDEVIARGNGLHGVLINDQDQYFVDPLSTSQGGSDATLRVTVTGSRFIDNGFTAIDQDGLRINEGGTGDLLATILGTTVTGNGGDGIELDERAAGHADFSVERTDLLRNGAFDPADFDDGIDVDESGDGDLIGRFSRVRANENYEQGVDLNENDAGNLRVTMANVEGSRNAEEGIEFEEDDDFAGGGDLIVDQVDIVANGNGATDGDAGLKLREKGDGNLSASIRGVRAIGNTISGIQIREDATGDLGADLQDIVATGNGADGIELDENSTGNLTVTLLRATAAGNTDAGVLGDQGGAGTGLLTLRSFRGGGNGGGDVVSNAGIIVDRGN